MRARMRTDRDGAGAVEYTSRRTDARGRPAEFRAHYRSTGPVRLSAPATLDHWLTERYCLYAVHGERVYRAEIHHHQWPLQPVDADLGVNTMVDAAGLQIAAPPQRLAFSASIDVVVWRPNLVR
jgi:hypothetical protein